MKIAVLSLVLVAATCFTGSSATDAILWRNVNTKLTEMKDAVKALCEGAGVTTPAVRSIWTSVPVTVIGSNNLHSARTFSFTIPSVIPSTAKNVLVYAAAYSGSANSVVNHIKIFTQDGSNKHYEKYLYLSSYRQNAVNTNSENMWFPMPANRKIYMTVSKGTGGNSSVHMYAIGYN